MNRFSQRKARRQLRHLIKKVAVTRTPVTICGDYEVVLVPAANWSAMQETLYLLSIPGFAASVRQGIATPPEECSATLDW